MSENANEYVANTSYTTYETFGVPVIPAQISGIGLEDTPYLNAIAMAREVPLSEDVTWREPGVPYSGSTSGMVWRTNHAGSYIELGGGGSEFINIIHKSGSRITIAGDGSVTISGAGDVVMTSDGNSVEMFDGTKTAQYGAGYTLSVSGGKTVISSNAGIDLVSGQDINIAAGGAINLNAGNGIDFASTRIAMTARVDTIDLYSAGKMSLQSEGTMNLLAADVINAKGEGMNLNGGGGNITATGSKIHLNSPGESGEPTPANQSGLGDAPPYMVDTQINISYSVGGIPANATDDVGEM